MKFNTQYQFGSWFETEMKKAMGNPSGWISPSKYEYSAKKILYSIDAQIQIPSIYGEGGWKGLAVYADRIWAKNFNLLSGYSSQNNSSGYSSKDSQSSVSSHKYSNTDYDSSNTVSQTGSEIIKRHNFDSSLRRIQAFSNNLPTIPQIDGFRTEGGLFGWGDHYINGYEMNRYAEDVQKLFKKHNDTIIQTIQEFRDVYTTFDYLDKEYLTGIVKSVNAATHASQGAKAASEQAKMASDQAKDAANKALKNEEDIKKDVENLRRLVEKIKSIKEDLSNKILILESNVKNLRQELSVRALSHEQQQTIKKLEKAFGHLKHIEDIDDIWNIVEIHDKNLDEILKRISDLDKNIGSEQRDSSQQLLSEEKNFKKNIVWAYAVAGVSLLVSLCSLIF